MHESAPFRGFLELSMNDVPASACMLHFSNVSPGNKNRKEASSYVGDRVLSVDSKGAVLKGWLRRRPTEEGNKHTQR